MTKIRKSGGYAISQVYSWGESTRPQRKDTPEESIGPIAADDFEGRCRLQERVILRLLGKIRHLQRINQKLRENLRGRGE